MRIADMWRIPDANDARAAMGGCIGTREGAREGRTLNEDNWRAVSVRSPSGARAHAGRSPVSPQVYIPPMPFWKPTSGESRMRR